MCGYGFARLRFPLKKFWFTLIISSLLLPLRGDYVANVYRVGQAGWGEYLLPLTVPGWFGGGAFNVFLLRQFFLTIPREIEDAAIIDGRDM
jgi:multiple sugar transport system permease protein